MSESKVSVIRMKNSPKGEPYALENISNTDPKTGDKIMQSWWASRGTLGLIMVKDGAEDSRYLKDYIDMERVPDSWPKKKGGTAKAPPKLPESLKAATAPRAPPSLGSRRASAPRQKCPGCDRLVEAQTTIKAQNGGCSVCGLPFVCGSCQQQLPKSRHYDGDDDPTPSGRLANLRCPGCGCPTQSSTGRDLWTMYTRRS